MPEISAQSVKALREKTGVGFMECKSALAESGGDEQKAIEILRKRGLAAAKKREGRSATEGIVGAYIHHGGKIGVLVEINCETDFVGRSPEFQGLVKDIAMHVCAAEPRFIKKEEVGESLLAKEREIAHDQALLDPKVQGKPEAVIDKIVEGRLNKFFAEAVLMEQPFVKDQTKTVGDLLREWITRTGENIQVRRFVRYKLGEDANSSSGDTETDRASD